jgi:hypothetical protein
VRVGIRGYIVGIGGRIVTSGVKSGKGSLVPTMSMRNMNQKMVVDEILSFYNRYKDNLIYRANCVRLWKECAEDKKNEYAGAYREALRKIGEV